MALEHGERPHARLRVLLQKHSSIPAGVGKCKLVKLGNFVACKAHSCRNLGSSCSAVAICTCRPACKINGTKLCVFIFVRIVGTFSRTCTGARVSDGRCLQNRSENQIYAVFVRQRFPSGIVGVGTVAVARSEAKFAFSPQVCRHSFIFMRFGDFKCRVDKFIAKFEEEL